MSRGSSRQGFGVPGLAPGAPRRNAVVLAVYLLVLALAAKGLLGVV